MGSAATGSVLSTGSTEEPGSISGLIYNYGQRADFDNWAQRGNRSWGNVDVLPYVKCTERRIGIDDDPIHGRTGNLPVTDIDLIRPALEAFIAGVVGAGIRHCADYNSGDHQEGVGYFQRAIYRGYRHSAARKVARLKNVRTINEMSHGVGLAGQIARCVFGRPSILSLTPSLVHWFWKSDNEPDYPDLQGVFGPASDKQGIVGLLEDVPGMTCGLWQHRAESVGFVRAVIQQN